MDTINVTLSNDQSYGYDPGTFGDEEGVVIKQQAMHYAISETERLDGVNVKYRYKPAPGFTGTDEVKLQSERGSDGASANDNIIITVIRFTITD